MKIIISGGGIAGLTLGLTAKLFGHHPIILQQRNSIDKSSFGGGIGLWPPSQMVMQRLGLLSQLQSHGMYMPSACYYNSQGYILGHPSNDFIYRFPVLCLEREQLTRSLYKRCLQEGVEFRVNSSVDVVQGSQDRVRVRLLNGQYIQGSMLIGTDGIGSKIRNIIMRQRQLPQIVPYHCNYAYFRAVVDIQHNTQSQWHKHAFQSWGQKKRFGYVPLKYPKTFWFVAIPIGQSGLQKIIGSHTCTEQHKRWIIQQFQYWQSPVNIKQLIQITPASTILRTDICKVKDVTSFPWQSRSKNIVILGDAANATAPNLAQGAGLAIQSAWDFISMVDIQSGGKNGLQEYLRKRKIRANTVQIMADMVAKVGQFDRPYSRIRNFVMKNSTYYMKSLQQRIFQQTVSHSVGGSSGKLYWIPSNIPSHAFHKNIRTQNCLLGKVVGAQKFNQLPKLTRQFRSSLIGYGSGTVTTHTLPLCSLLLGLPTNMTNRPFQAYCQTQYLPDGSTYMKWIRTFGYGKINAAKYTTQHRMTPNLSNANTNTNKYGYVLTQTLGTAIDILGLRFGYTPIIADNGTLIYYKSCGLWMYSYRLPIPKILLPVSQWKQKQVQNGWQFDGTIAMPKIVGGFGIMRYSGTFQPQRYSHGIVPNNRRVIIAGGTGMIGSIVARELYLSGYTVEILTRASKNKNNVNSIGSLPFAKIHTWNPSEYHSEAQVDRLVGVFEGAEAVVNLSGENPGSGLWSKKKKDRIVGSRVDSVRLIAKAIRRIQQKNKHNKHNRDNKNIQKTTIKYLQASAAGIYGNRDQQILNDNQQPGSQNTFRIQTCKQIQQITKQLCADAGILRIGHVLSSQGGIFPSLQLASKFRVKRFGSGGQYIPWIHIQDVACSITHIIQNINKYTGKTINIVSPGHSTYDGLLSVLAQVRGRRGCILPVPERLLKFVLGEMSSVLFDSQRMHPQMLLENGYKFRYGVMEKALTSRECL